MTQHEYVPATRLRPGDTLYACGTTCDLDDVNTRTDHVELRTNCRCFRVPLTTRFKRVVRSRRIQMGRRATRGAR